MTPLILNQVASVAEAVDAIALGTANGPMRFGLLFFSVISAASTIVFVDGPPEGRDTFAGQAGHELDAEAHAGRPDQRAGAYGVIAGVPARTRGQHGVVHGLDADFQFLES